MKNLIFFNPPKCNNKIKKSRFVQGTVKPIKLSENDVTDDDRNNRCESWRIIMYNNTYYSRVTMTHSENLKTIVKHFEGSHVRTLNIISWAHYRPIYYVQQEHQSSAYVNTRYHNVLNISIKPISIQKKKYLSSHNVYYIFYVFILRIFFVYLYVSLFK